MITKIKLRLDFFFFKFFKWFDIIHPSSNDVIYYKRINDVRQRFSKTRLMCSIEIYYVIYMLSRAKTLKKSNRLTITGTESTTQYSNIVFDYNRSSIVVYLKIIRINVLYYNHTVVKYNAYNYMVHTFLSVLQCITYIYYFCANNCRAQWRDEFKHIFSAGNRYRYPLLLHHQNNRKKNLAYRTFFSFFHYINII